jgi:hypothetical protein
VSVILPLSFTSCKTWSAIFNNKIKIAHIFQFVKFPVMENREIDAAGKEHRMEFPPFLTYERSNTGRPYSRNKDFLEKRRKSQDARLKRKRKARILCRCIGFRESPTCPTRPTSSRESPMIPCILFFI